jgi:CoA:oxalate CoA-transferase
LSTPFGCFRTRDGQVVIAVLNGGQFRRLAALIGRPEIADDSRFATDSSRTENEPALRALIEEWSGAMATEQAVAVLAEQGLPAAPIWSIAQAANSEHSVARGLVGTLMHPILGKSPIVGQPVRFDGVKPAASSAAPRLGADLAAVLKEFGLGDEHDADR